MSIATERSSAPLPSRRDFLRLATKATVATAAGGGLAGFLSSCGGSDVGEQSRITQDPSTTIIRRRSTTLGNTAAEGATSSSSVTTTTEPTTSTEVIPKPNPEVLADGTLRYKVKRIADESWTPIVDVPEWYLQYAERHKILEVPDWFGGFDIKIQNQHYRTEFSKPETGPYFYFQYLMEMGARQKGWIMLNAQGQPDVPDSQRYLNYLNNETEQVGFDPDFVIPIQDTSKPENITIATGPFVIDSGNPALKGVDWKTPVKIANGPDTDSLDFVQTEENGDIMAYYPFPGEFTKTGIGLTASHGLQLAVVEANRQSFYYVGLPIRDKYPQYSANLCGALGPAAALWVAAGMVNGVGGNFDWGAARHVTQTPDYQQWGGWQTTEGVTGVTSYEIGLKPGQMFTAVPTGK